MHNNPLHRMGLLGSSLGAMLLALRPTPAPAPTLNSFSGPRMRRGTQTNSQKKKGAAAKRRRLRKLQKQARRVNRAR